jgi:SAM-dependent methyltransferase
MASQYDVLARLTELTAEMPLRKYYEEFTVLGVLGELRGKSVLDVACGTGLYSRRFARLGAARVVGVDNSEGMIGYARHLEEQERLGIAYHVLDATRADTLGRFDVVTATYLLHYSPSKQVLGEMCRALYGALGPGGRLVSICMSPDIELADRAYYHPYGFEMTSRGQEGDEATLSSLMPEVPFAIQAWHWKRETYEAALREAGFRDVTWHAPRISPEGLERFGADYWAAYLRRPHARVFDCRR